eukprot:5934536-Prymnesium_polylepis.2
MVRTELKGSDQPMSSRKREMTSSAWSRYVRCDPTRLSSARAGHSSLMGDCCRLGEAHGCVIGSNVPR